jgi:hypothetical protein
MFLIDREYVHSIYKDDCLIVIRLKIGKLLLDIAFRLIKQIETIEFYIIIYLLASLSKR